MLLFVFSAEKNGEIQGERQVADPGFDVGHDAPEVTAREISGYGHDALLVLPLDADRALASFHVDQAARGNRTPHRRVNRDLLHRRQLLTVSFLETHQDVVFVSTLAIHGRDASANGGPKRIGEIRNVQAHRRGFFTVDRDQHLGLALPATHLGIGNTGHIIDEVFHRQSEIAGHLHVVAADLNGDAVFPSAPHPHEEHPSGSPRKGAHSRSLHELGSQGARDLGTRALALGLIDELHANVRHVGRGLAPAASADIGEHVIHFRNLLGDELFDFPSDIVGHFDSSPHRKLDVQAHLALVRFRHQLEADQRNQ